MGGEIEREKRRGGVQNIYIVVVDLFSNIKKKNEIIYDKISISIFILNNFIFKQIF